MRRTAKHWQAPKTALPDNCPPLTAAPNPVGKDQAGGGFDMWRKDDDGLFAGNGCLHLIPAPQQSAPTGPARQVVERAAGVDYRRFKQVVRVSVWDRSPGLAGLAIIDEWVGLTAWQAAIFVKIAYLFIADCKSWRCTTHQFFLKVGNPAIA